jgi:hypothetical protein
VARKLNLDANISAKAQLSTGAIANNLAGPLNIKENSF